MRIKKKEQKPFFKVLRFFLMRQYETISICVQNLFVNKKKEKEKQLLLQHNLHKINK